MWPGRSPAARSTASVRSTTIAGSPSSAAGSRLPCTARSFPIRSQARSRGIRQSTPTTSGRVASAPGVAIISRRVAVLVPKWIRGTPKPAVASKIAAVWGATYSA